MRLEPVRVCRHRKNTSLCANEYSMGQDLLADSMDHGTAFEGVDNPLLDGGTAFESMDNPLLDDARIMMELRQDEYRKQQGRLCLPHIWRCFEGDTGTARDINHNSRTSPPSSPTGFEPESSSLMSPVNSCGYPQISLASKFHKSMASSNSTDNDNPPSPPVVDHFGVQFLERLSRGMLQQEYPYLVEPSSRIGNYSKLAHTPLQMDSGSLDASYHYLNMSGWYYGPLTTAEARERLRPHPVGTFLLRDSSDPKYMFALSFKTRRGTTSIRIIYEDGQFRMDAEMGKDNEHSFHCIMQLIENYVIKSKKGPDSAQLCMLLESTGRMDTPLRMSRGCVKFPSSLKHMSRVAVNKSMTKEQTRRLLMFMPPDIESYMTEYPFTV